MVDAQPRAKFRMWDDMAVWVGEGVSTDTHEHQAMAIGMTLADPIEIEVAGMSIKVTGAVAEPNVPFASDATVARRILYIMLDPFTERAERVRKGLLKGQPFAFFDSTPYREQLSAIEERIYAGDDEGTRSATVAIFNAVVGEPGFRKPMDWRIRKALEYIPENLDKKVRVAELAELAELSVSRFQHRFKDEVGAPVRRYLLWCRMRRAMELAIDGESLTHAAAQAGFSDAAHLSRTFRKMFGIPPKKALELLR